MREFLEKNLQKIFFDKIEIFILELRKMICIKDVKYLKIVFTNFVMKKKFLIIVFAIISFVGIEISSLYMSRTDLEKISDIQLANIEALAGKENWLEEWWNSKVYTCQPVQVWEYQCMPYKDIPREDGNWEIGGNFAPDEIVCGMFLVWSTECVGGHDVAHCWDCD